MTDYFPHAYGRRNPYFEALLKEGTNTSPIGAHSQGMSRLAFALLAGLERGQMDRKEREPRQSMQPPAAIANTPAAGAGPSMNAPLAGPRNVPVAARAGAPQSAPEPAPYLTPHPESPSEFMSRWSSQRAFGSQLPGWFSAIKRQHGWEE